MKYTKDDITTFVKDEDDYELDSIVRKLNEYEEGRAAVKAITIWVCIGIVALAAVIIGLMIALPNYGVWKAELEGKAKLAEAEFSKQVQVREAESNLEAEKLNASAEVERAKGAAEARKTEGLGMTAEQYIQYLWVKKLDLSQSKTIYLPTEGGLPKMVNEVEK